MKIASNVSKSKPNRKKITGTDNKKEGQDQYDDKSEIDINDPGAMCGQNRRIRGLRVDG